MSTGSADRTAPPSSTTVLVYHTGALGDFVTILPTLALLRRTQPTAHVVLLGRPFHGEAAREVGLLDEIWNVDDRRFLSLFTGTPNEMVVRSLMPFSLALVFASPDSPVVLSLQRAGIRQLRVQPPFPASGIHAVDYHLSLLNGQATAQSLDSFRTPMLRASASRTADTATSPILIQPGSGSSRKNWPFPRFIQLAERLEAKGFIVEWICGPAEESFPFPSHAAVRRPPSITALVDLLGNARLFVGNDSGVSHLAAACGCRSIVLFGPSDPSVWAPRGTHVRILDAAPPCRPCHPSPSVLPQCRRECVRSITVETVLEECLSHCDQAVPDASR